MPCFQSNFWQSALQYLYKLLAHGYLVILFHNFWSDVWSDFWTGFWPGFGHVVTWVMTRVIGEVFCSKICCFRSSSALLGIPGARSVAVLAVLAAIPRGLTRWGAVLPSTAADNAGFIRHRDGHRWRLPVQPQSEVARANTHITRKFQSDAL